MKSRITFFQSKDFFQRRISKIQVSIFAFLILSFSVSSVKVMAQAYTPGNIVALRVGDGSAALGSGSTAFFLDEYTTSGTSVNTFTVPTTGTNRLTMAGSSPNEGQMTRTSDGTQLVIGGYDATTGVAAIAGTTAALTNRCIGTIGALYSSYIRAVASTTAFNTGNIRGVVKTGNDYWADGSVTGIAYFGTGTPATVSSTVTNCRSVNVYNGQLYFSTGSGTTRGVYIVGTGLPTTSGNTSTSLLNGGAAASPNAFQFNSSSTICYVADDRAIASGGGIQKWIFSSGSWSLLYTLGTGTNGCLGVCVDFSGTDPVVYATTTETNNNRIIKVTDTGAGSVAATLASAGTNKAFRGIQFAPVNPCTPPELSTSTTSSCSNASNGSVTLTVTGGVSPTYLWSNSETTQNLTNVASGTYTVTVIDGGCSTSTSATVSSIAAPTPTITGSLSFCAGGNTTLSTQTFSSYLWTGGSTDQSLNVSSAGTYTVTVSDGTCTGSASATVVVHANPTPSISGVTTVCGGGSTTLSSAAAFAGYQWSTNETTQSISVNTSGNYNLTVTDAFGCTGSTSVVVSISASLSPIITGGLSFCTGGSTTLSTQTFLTYLWSDNSTDQSLIVSTAGTYTVTVSDGSCTGSATAIVTVNPLPTPTISGNPTICFGTSSVFDAGAGYSSYQWSTSASTQNVSINTAGTFTVTVTDVNGCSGSTSITTTVTTNFNVLTSATNATHCAGETSTIIATGAVSYTWSPAVGLNVTTGNSVIATPLTTTIYTVTGTSANGCTKNGFRKITVIPLPALPTAPSPITYCQYATAVPLTATVNPAHYNLSWYNTPTGGIGSTNVPTPSTAVSGTSTYYVSQSATGLQLGIIGWIDNQTPDLFAVVALADIPAGQDIYFTDNGWTGTGFRGATVTDHNGNEDLCKLHIINTITAGAIIQSYSSSADYAWTTTGLIDPAFPTGGSYAALLLAAANDQIYAFTSTDPLNPLFNPTKHLFVFDDTNGFETATTAASGDVPPGLSVALGTAVTFPATFASANLISMNNDGGSRTVDDWYLYIKDATNYTLETANPVTGLLPAGNLNMLQSCEGPRAEILVNVLPAPVPNASSNTPVCFGSDITLLSANGMTSYSWTGPNSFGSTNQNPVINNASALNAGPYTITVTGVNGCTFSETISMAVNPLPTVSFTGLPVSICNNDVAITLTSNQSSGNFSGNGITNNGNGTASFNPASATVGSNTITFSFTDINGCSNSTSQSITVNASPDIQAIATQSNTCPVATFDLSTISIVNNGASGTVTYHATLADAQNNTNAISSTVNSSGTYYIRITTALGCYDYEPVLVSLITCPCVIPPISNAGSNFAICANGSALLNGSISGSASSSSWSGGTGSFNPDANTLNAVYSPSAGEISAGFVTLTLTTDDPDGNGPCVPGVSSVTITIHSLPSVSVNPSSTSVCIGSSTTLNAIGTGTFTWSPSTDLNSTVGSTVISTPSGNTTYTVTLTDNNGCSNTATASVSVNALPIVGSSALPSTICLGSSTSLSATGGVSFTWTPQSGLSSSTGSPVNASPASSVTYTVTATDNNGCSGTSTVQVNVLSLPVVSISGINGICNGSATSLDAGSGYSSYNWSTGASTQGISVAVSGTYTVTVTDANGCSNSASKVLVNFSPPSISGNATGVTCNGNTDGAVNISVTGGQPCDVSGPGLIISKVFANPVGNDSPFEFVELVATQNINFASTPYTVIFVNNGSGTVNGWKAGAALTYAFQITTGTAIKGGVYYVGGSSMIPVGNRLRTINTATTAGDGIGNALLSGVLGNGGANADAVGVFNTTVALMTPSTVPVDAFFFGTAIGNAVVSGGTAGYELPINDHYNGGKLQSTSFFGPDAALSNYYIKATGTYDMVAHSYSTVRTFTLDTIGNFVEGNSSVSLVNTSNYYYNWSNNSTTQNISGLSGGTYTVTVSDCNGCSSTASFNVVEPGLLTANCNVTHLISCHGDADGSATVAVSGGTSPYQYTWDNGATTATLNGLIAGTYCVTVTDAHGCTATCCFTLTDPDVLLSNGVATNVTCKNAKNGTITLSTSGGTTPYSYLWNGGSTNSSRTGLAPGTYSVIVTDAHGCVANNSFTILQSATPLALNINKTNIQCGGKCTGSAIASPVGGTMPYLYNWSNGATSTSITGLCAGTFTIVVTDAYGCVRTTVFNITANPVLVVVVTPSGPTQATASVSGGVPAYTYLWNTVPPQVTPTAISLSPGSTYKVKVIDSKGCAKITSITMPLPRNVSNGTSALLQNDISVYPNPASDHISLNFVNQQSELNYTVKMYDITGRIVFDKQETKQSGITIVDYQIGYLPKGIYTLSIQTELGISVVKIVLQ